MVRSRGYSTCHNNFRYGPKKTSSAHITVTPDSCQADAHISPLQSTTVLPNPWILSVLLELSQIKSFVEVFQADLLSSHSRGWFLMTCQHFCSQEMLIFISTGLLRSNCSTLYTFIIFAKGGSDLFPCLERWRQR